MDLDLLRTDMLAGGNCEKTKFEKIDFNKFNVTFPDNDILFITVFNYSWSDERDYHR